jgi:long-chain fatty acid transport protein
MRRSRFVHAAVAALVAAPVAASAQGSMVDQQSACMAARGGTGVAEPCAEGSAAWFNPAALAETGTVISAGAAVIRAGNAFRYDPAYLRGGDAEVVNRPTSTALAPQGYLAVRVNPRLAAGIAVLFPYGLGLEWPVCPVEDPRCAGGGFEGRFTGYDNALRALYVQPTVAYQLVPGQLSIGAGVDYVRGTLEINRREFGPPALGLGNTEVADARFAGGGSALTYHLAALARPTDRVSIGIRYLGEAGVDLEGDASFRQVSTGLPTLDVLIGAGLPPDQGVSSRVRFPAQLVVGTALRVDPGLTVMGDLQRTFWTSFDELPVRFDARADETIELGYRDANTFRLGAEYAATDAVVVRAGFRYNEAATPRATPLLPEGERTYWTLGVGFRPLAALSTDLSLQYVAQPDRAGPVLPGGPRAGIYESSGTVLNLTLAWRLGRSGAAAR